MGGPKGATGTPERQGVYESLWVELSDGECVCECAHLGFASNGRALPIPS